MTGERVRVIVVTGPPGVGKSTTAIALSDVLAQRDIVHAMIDMDHLRWFVPGPEDDPRNVQLGLNHLHVLAQSYIAAGAEILIVADVVPIEEPHRMFEQAIPQADVTIVGLRLPIAEIFERIRIREPEGQHDWFMQKASLVARRYEEANVGDIVIECGGKTSVDVARHILASLAM